ASASDRCLPPRPASDCEDGDSSRSGCDERRRRRRRRRQHPSDGEYLTWSEQTTVLSTIFNFTNSIIGAGAMGLGGAFAASGGGISVLCLIGFAYLTKTSLDLIVDLSSCPEVLRRVRLERRLLYGARNHDGNHYGEEEEIHFSGGESSDTSSSGGGDFFTPKIDLSTQRQVLLGGEGDCNDDNDDDDDYGGGKESESSLDRRIEDLQQDNAEEESEINIEAIELDRSSQHENQTENDASPLMATEDHSDGSCNDIDGEHLHGSGRNHETAKLFNLDHPLASSFRDFDNIKRYDSLNAGKTPPLQNELPMDINGDIPTSKVETANRPDYDVGETDDTNTPCTYEELGRAAFGSFGRMSVLLSKALYSFGCLIAYVVVTRDNFGVAIRRLARGSPSFTLMTWECENDECNNGRYLDDATLSESNDEPSWWQDDGFLAFWVSAIFMLPLSCPRTMEPLAKFSFFSILSIFFLVGAVIYLYFTCTDPAGGAMGDSTFYENWIQVRSFSGLFRSLGTFVFTFICHHTVNLAYEELPPEIRHPRIWRRVSTNSIVLATETSLSLGIFTYLTFGVHTPTDVLMGYPSDLTVANIARLLLCATMVLTFPLPFLTCREMITLIMVDIHNHCRRKNSRPRCGFFQRRFSYFGGFRAKLRACLRRQRHDKDQIETHQDEHDEEQEGNFVEMRQPTSYFGHLKQKLGSFRIRSSSHAKTDHAWWDEINEDGRNFTRPLLNERNDSEEEEDIPILQDIGGGHGREVFPSPLSSPSSSESEETSSSDESTTYSFEQLQPPSWIVPGSNGRQLAPAFHAIITFLLWLIVTILAIKAPTLGDVLDLVGAFTGTMIAFILPGLFSFKLKGYTRMSCAILVIGGVVGSVGTFFSFVKFAEDLSNS
ncbi:hypothetical protein ACHAXS_005561, partial [Conticribra weissflogii]